jgi:hypothetical protein
LETGENTGTTTGKSMYWVGGEWIWRSCDVLSYDLEDARYTIRFRGSQRLKKVRRINLRFDHENHELFEKRVFAAQSAREECKARLRLQHYMQDMPVENVSPVRSEILKSICRRIAMPQVTGGAKRGIPRSKEKDRKIKLYGSSSSERGGRGSDGGALQHCHGGNQVGNQHFGWQCIANPLPWWQRVGNALPTLLPGWLWRCCQAGYGVGVLPKRVTIGFEGLR